MLGVVLRTWLYEPESTSRRNAAHDVTAHTFGFTGPVIRELCKEQIHGIFFIHVRIVGNYCTTRY